MKRILLALAVISGMAANAQTDTTKNWTRGGVFGLNFTQASFTNWAAGGVNSVSGQVLLNLFSNYKKGDNTWDNTLEMSYGLLQQGKASLLRKTDDKIDFTSKYGRKAFNEKWYYSALFNFKSQFMPGYNYISDTSKVKISDWLAPAYGLIALGMDYKPNTKFTLFISPLTGRITIVNDGALSAAGAFGVKPGEKIRNEFGGYVRAQYRADIIQNVNLTTRLELFSNYLDRPQNIDVNAEVLLTMKVNKYISASINMQAIYDNDINIKGDYNNDGVIGANEAGPRLQFRQVLGIGFNAKF
jgi:hypothetical protein